MVNKNVLKGTYCLLINLKSESNILIGKLGEINFQSGYYVYVGSALNSLKGRIKRHLSSNKKLHWHVDYFLAHKDVEIVDVLYVIDETKWECKLADKIADINEGVEKFGCSDCKCPSHLFYFEKLDDLNEKCLRSFEVLDLSPLSYFDNKLRIQIS